MKSIIASILATSAFATVNLIIDTDLGFDVDDMGALALAHHYADEGRVNLLATMHSTACDLGIAAVHVVNAYYGRGDLPVGAYKGDFGWDCNWNQDHYLSDLIDSYPDLAGNIKDSGDVDDVFEVYQRVLEAAEDNSVTIAVVGFPMNVRNLLRWKMDLFTAKVKAVYYMNGFYNFGCADNGSIGQVDGTDCERAAQESEELFPHSVKKYFNLNGSDICTGGDFSNTRDDSNPVSKAYRDWVGDWSGGDCYPGRASWDPLTVYAAIVGTEEAQMWEEEGTDEVDYDGGENWHTDWKGNNEFSLWFLNDDRKPGVEDTMNQAIYAEPKARKLSQEFLQ